VSELSGFCFFSRRREHGSARKFFSGFKKKHLIITTHVEKQCTRALNHTKFSQCVYKQYKFLSFKFQVFTSLNKEIPYTSIKRAFCVMEHENSSQLKQCSGSLSGKELNLVGSFSCWDSVDKKNYFVFYQKMSFLLEVKHF